jgi:hypothetical protein
MLAKPNAKMKQKLSISEAVLAPTADPAQARVTQIETLNGEMPQNPCVYLDVRCSTKKQEDGTSIKRQIESGKAVCQRYNWKLTEANLIRNIGVSGWKKGKDGKAKIFSPGSEFGKFLEKARKGFLPPNTLIIFDHPDRFGRAGIRQSDSVLWELVDAGVMVYFVSNGMLLRKGDDTNLLIKRIILLIEFDQAQKSSELTSNRLKKALDFKLDMAAQGVPVSLNVFYPAWIKYLDEPPRFEFVPEKEKVIRRVLSMLVDENMTPSRIATILNEEGVKTMEKDGAWCHGYIRGLARFPGLIGTFAIDQHVIRDGKNVTITRTFPNYYKAIATQRQWEFLQAKFGKKAMRGGGSPADSVAQNLFPGRVRCHHCGAAMKVFTGGSNYHTYECSGAKFKYTDCKRHPVYVDAIELSFFGLLLEKTPLESMAPRQGAILDKINTTNAQLVAVNSEVEKLAAVIQQAPLEQLTLKMKRLYDEQVALKAKLAELTLYTYATSGLNTAKASVVKTLAGLDSMFAVSDDILDQLLTVSKTLKAQLADRNIRRRLVEELKALVESIIIDGKKLRYRVKFAGSVVSEWRDVTGATLAMKEATIMKRAASLKRFWEQHPERREERSRKTAERLAKLPPAVRKARGQALAARYARWRAKLTPKQVAELHARKAATFKKTMAAMPPERRKLLSLRISRALKRHHHLKRERNSANSTASN